MNRIKRLRLKNNFSLDFICKAINVKLKDYVKYEDNYKIISVDVLYALAEFYDVSTDYLIYRTDRKKPYKKH